MLQHIKNIENKKIIFAPLDWGLGHFYRLIPFIYIYSKKNNLIFLYCSKKIKYIAKKELEPFNINIKYITTKSLNIKYSYNGLTLKNLTSIFFKLLLQSFFDTYFAKKIVKKHKIDFIISDCRYFFRNKKVFSVFITHQLNFATPKKFLFIKKFALKINKYLIEKFNECWVLDISSKPNFAGFLSENILKINNIQYIGIISRFQIFNNKNLCSTNLKNNSKKIVLCLLSLPYPYKKNVLSKIIKKFINSNYKVFIIKGDFYKKKNSIKKIKNIIILDYIQTSHLLKKIISADFIVCTSGYTTLMDLISLNKKAYLIPTKGQWEQEYLAKYFIFNYNFFSFNDLFINLSSI